MTVNSQKPYQHLNDEQLVEYLSKLPSIPDNLPSLVSQRAGIETVYADVLISASGRELGLAFLCKYCNQIHVHSPGNGMRKAHCDSSQVYKLGHYYVKSTGVRKVCIL